MTINIHSQNKKYVSRTTFDMFNTDKKYFYEKMKTITKTIMKSIKHKVNYLETNNTFNTFNTFNTLEISMEPHKYKFFPESEDDLHSKYINKRGLLKSCDIHSNYPVSDILELIGYDISKMFDGCSIYICTSALPKFIEILEASSSSIDSNIHSNTYKIKHKFVLVSGDSIDTCPDDIFTSHTEFLDFINNPLLIHWYAQNCVVKHKKITGIPLGIAYHHMIDEEDPKQASRFISPKIQEQLVIDIEKKSKPFWERDLKCYISFLYSFFLVR